MTEIEKKIQTVLGKLPMYKRHKLTDAAVHAFNVAVEAMSNSNPNCKEISFQTFAPYKSLELLVFFDANSSGTIVSTLFETNKKKTHQILLLLILEEHFTVC